MIVKVLGSGCKNCKKLEEQVKQAVSELGIQAEVIKVDDVMQIMTYGVMRTPALVVNEKVKVMGRVPSVDEIKRFLV